MKYFEQVGLNDYTIKMNVSELKVGLSYKKSFGRNDFFELNVDDKNQLMVHIHMDPEED